MSFLDSAFPAVINTTGFDVAMYNRIVDGITDIAAAMAQISDQSGNIILGSAKTINFDGTPQFALVAGKVQVNELTVTNTWTYGTLAIGDDCVTSNDLTVDAGGTMTLTGNLVVTGKIDVDTVTGSSLTIAQIAEPGDPENAHGVLWCSNGTGDGDVGDIMVKIRHGGVVKSTTLVDFV